MIRTVRVEDAQKVLDIQKSVVAEKNYFLTTTEEFAKTVEEQEKSIEKVLGNQREAMLVVEVNDEVVGWLLFQSPPLKRLSHVGTFGIMIQKEYRSMGLGKQLIQTMLTWAEKNPLIEKVCLGVFSTNTKAISLYKKMGFQIEGRKVKEIKIEEDTYIDDILMYRLV